MSYICFSKFFFFLPHLEAKKLKRDKKKDKKEKMHIPKHWWTAKQWFVNLTPNLHFLTIFITWVSSPLNAPQVGFRPGSFSECLLGFEHGLKPLSHHSRSPLCVYNWNIFLLISDLWKRPACWSKSTTVNQMVEFNICEFSFKTYFTPPSQVFYLLFFLLTAIKFFCLNW